MGLADVISLACFVILHYVLVGLVLFLLIHQGMHLELFHRKQNWFVGGVFFLFLEAV